MLMRLKVPPAINQFNGAIDKNQAAHVLKLAKKYMPETREAKKIMLMRLKVPPAINQFNGAIDKNQAAHVLKLGKKYMPETREAKKNRLMEMAQQKKAGEEVKTKKPMVLKYG